MFLACNQNSRKPGNLVHQVLFEFGNPNTCEICAWIQKNHKVIINRGKIFCELVWKAGLILLKTIVIQKQLYKEYFY